MINNNTINSFKAIGSGIAGQYNPHDIRERCDQKTPPLAAQVATLERRANALDSICGEMIACLAMNLNMGKITTEDDASFNMMLDSWSEQRRRVS